MAIRIDCYELITPVQIGKQYFPKQYAEEWCWNDGVICTPMRAMNPWGMDSIMETCEELSLKRFREENRLADSQHISH